MTCFARAWLALAASLFSSASFAQTAVRTGAPESLSVEAAQRFATLTLKCIHLEYPTKIAHALESDADVLPPRDLFPAFHGCYDWHSDVHAHWVMTRLARLYPDAPFAPAARAALAQSLTAENIAGEVRYLDRPVRASFARPYGLAWLLKLAAELRAWDDPQAKQWSRNLEPLESLAATRIKKWLPELTYAIRIGEHDQTAFSFGLIWDWAGRSGDTEMRTLLAVTSRHFYLPDRDCPMNYEPSGHDFLSPCLAEADLMRRLLPPAEFGPWLRAFLPKIPNNARKRWLAPATVTNRADPKLAHLDGLNLSRAWMLEGIANGLPRHDPRIAALEAAAQRHRDAALPEITGEFYEGGHWLGTFAVYLATNAGLE
ncbi:MAG TPA: DUF2891 domain-containing protein [Steroidobacteraceae bacterium]|nr:DUF2891 domain-containing protein [Steroidobacteraceae bacterium]